MAGFAAIFASAAAPAADLAIVLQDEVALRPAPRNGSRPNALLWQGEIVEVRGERLEYLQVYDYRRERGGYVRASQVRRTVLEPREAPEFLAVLRFLRDVPGNEALGIGFAAAYIEAAPADVLNGAAGIEALDALGTLAERLARAASAGASQKAAQAALAAHLDVAARHGVQLVSVERDGRMRVCYDGMAFRRVLLRASDQEQRARAALALTRRDCISKYDAWHAEVLDKVDESRLPPIPKNRVLMRRAAVWSSLAYQRARQGEDAASAAERALDALAGINKSDLTEADLALYTDAAIRVSASRWAAVPSRDTPRITATTEETGETCVTLSDAKKKPLAKRCTYGLVWTASATLNREATALALAVQQSDSWLELWIFHKAKAGWTVRVLAPASITPNVGYAELAGWVPGGRQFLVAREAIGEGKKIRRFEQLRLDTLAPVVHAGQPAALVAFRRWQDPSWKGLTLSLR
ncbi:MAG: hypothetical protein EPO20_28710 [Betaproteobacteria bacterium]|nr:MAG: hypothetical protein EPO20_28710 [Betaproteobacteria bacterium]